MFTELGEKKGILSLFGTMLLLVVGCTSDGGLGITMPDTFDGLGSFAGGKPNLVMIDLIGMTVEEAKANLKSHNIRNRLEVLKVEDEGGWGGACSPELLVEGRIVIIEKGRICEQASVEGTHLFSHEQLIKVRVLREDPWHGKIGTPMEWHRMPNVVGMPLAEAQAAMQKAGFTKKDTITIKEVSGSDCKVGHVCSTNPVALMSALQHGAKTLEVGAALATSPTDNEVKKDTPPN